MGPLLIAAGIVIFLAAYTTLQRRIFERNPNAENILQASSDPLAMVFRICTIIALTLIGIGALLVFIE
jgi:hypothetical protein